MKLQAQTIETETEGFDDAAEMSMETTDPAVIQIMLENIYPDPYVWPRELLANWIDADPEGKGGVILPEVLEPNWIIEDLGPGMDHEFMLTKYSKIFHSTKRDNNDKIGGFGHGRLSPLAYTDNYSVRSRFMQGGVVMEGNYLIFKGENKIPRVTPLSLEVSDVQQTGVTVTIPIGDRDIKRIKERTAFFASYLAKQPEGFEPVKYRFKNDNGGVRDVGQEGDMPGVRLIVGGVPYPAPNAARLATVPFDLFFETGDLSPTLDRGAINGDADALERIKAKYKKLIDDYKEGVLKIIEKETTIFDKYAKYIELSSGLEYNIRSAVFTDYKAISNLPAEAIFKSASGDFNLHELSSEIDRSAWRDLDLETKNLRSLMEIKIKNLTKHGTIQRHGGDDVSSATHINLERYVDRYQATNDPQIMIFGIKLPYQTGQIKLIKEAIAAELTAKRTAPNTFGTRVKILLIQYENEDDVAKIAGLISAKIKPVIITDNSKRTAGATYVSAIVADSAGGYSTTKPVRVKALKTDSTMVFFIRPKTVSAHKIHTAFDNLRRLDPFKGKTLVAIAAADAALLPANYPTIGETLYKYLKKQGYTVDTTVVSAYLTKAQRTLSQNDRVGRMLSDQVLVKSKKTGTFAELIQTNAALMGDKVISDAIKVATSGQPIGDLELIQKISNTAYAVTSIQQTGILDNIPSKLNRPMPPVETADTTALTEFDKKYPLIEIMRKMNEYQFRNYGIDKKIVDAIVDYMESKQQARN